MKSSLICFLFLISLISFPEIVIGQVKIYITDSVPVLKPDVRKKIFNFRDSSDLILEYRRNSYVSHNNAEGGSAQVITINNKSKTSNKVIWKFGGTITDKSNGYSWKVSIFCEGYIEKAVNSLSNENVSSRKTRWNKGGYGFMIQGNDTAGIFLITLDALEDRMQDDFLSAHTRNITDYASAINVKKLTAGRDFIITGMLKDRKFTILSNASEFKTWIYMTDGLKGIFFSDFDNCIKKNYEGPRPFVLVDKMTLYRERCDLYRLAMLSKLADEILKIRFG